MTGGAVSYPLNGTQVHAAAKQKATAPVGEIGYVQAPNFYWWLYDNETTPELQWPQSIAIYDTMRRQDAQIRSVIKAVTLPLLRTPWRIDPAAAKDEVVRLVADDLGLPIVGKDPEPTVRSRDRFQWLDHLREALTMVVFGHSVFEQIYRVDKDGSRAHLKKLSPRPQSTIDRFNVDDDGGLESIQQRWATGENQPTPIPISRLVAYAYEKEGGNWLGVSMLRAAYKNWLLKDRLLRVQAQTIERNGMGIPIYLAQEDASSEDLIAGKAMAMAWRSGQAAGTAVPHGADIQLRGVSGTLPDAESAIRYHDEQIARSALAHFLNLGTQTGSWALGSTFADFFTMSLQALARQIADTFTSYVIEDLVDVNFGEDEPAPRLCFDEIGSRPDATAIASLLQSGAIVSDDTLEAALRQQYGLPPKDPTSQRPDASGAPDAATPDQPTPDDGGGYSGSALYDDGSQPVAASAGDEDLTDEEAEEVDALVAALASFSNRVEAAELRQKLGTHKGGQWTRSLDGELIEAIEHWVSGGGSGRVLNPKTGRPYTTAQLRTVAKRTPGVPQRQGADGVVIERDLREHLKELQAAQVQTPAAPAEVAKKAAPRATTSRASWQVSKNKAMGIDVHTAEGVGHIAAFRPDAPGEKPSYRAYQEDNGGVQNFETLQEAKDWLVVAAKERQAAKSAPKAEEPKAPTAKKAKKAAKAAKPSAKDVETAAEDGQGDASVKFTADKAKTFSPVTQVKRAVIMDAPEGKETVIEPEWGGEQRFVGSWVAVKGEDGKTAYGSALKEWTDMHERVPGEKDGWQKTATVSAYQHTGPDAPFTTTLADGTVETTNTVHAGDWIVQQKNGEVQIIRDDKFRKLYDAESPKAPSKANAKDLHAMKVPDLRKLARERGIKSPSTMNRAALLAALGASPVAASAGEESEDLTDDEWDEVVDLVDAVSAITGRVEASELRQKAGTHEGGEYARTLDGHLIDAIKNWLSGDQSGRLKNPATGKPFTAVQLRAVIARTPGMSKPAAKANVAGLERQLRDHIEDLRAANPDELDPVEKARAEGAKFEHAKGIASTLAEVEQLVHNGTSDRGLDHRLDASAHNHDLPPEMVERLRTAAKSGRRADLEAAVTSIADENGLKRTSGPAGSVEAFDRRIHEPIGASADYTGATKVRVLSPAYSVQGHPTIRAAVQEATPGDIAEAAEGQAGRDARNRQARIDKARPAADTLAELSELHGNEADPEVIAERLRKTGAGVQPSLLKDLIAAGQSGDRKRIDEVSDRVAQQYGLTRISGPAGAVEPYDPTMHKAIGGGVKAGEPVQVVRPVYGYDPGDGQVNLGKAAVEKVDEPTPAPKVAKKAVPKVPATKDGKATLSDIRSAATGEDAEALLKSSKHSKAELVAMVHEASGQKPSAKVTIPTLKAMLLDETGHSPTSLWSESMGDALAADRERNPLTGPLAGLQEARRLSKLNQALRGAGSRPEAERLLAPESEAQLRDHAEMLGVPGFAEMGGPQLRSAILDEAGHGDAPGRAASAVVAAYSALLARKPNRESNRWVSLADLRDELGQSHSRADVDDALKSLYGRPGVFLEPESNQSTLTARDRGAAIRIAAENNHFLRIDRPAAILDEVGHGDSGEPSMLAVPHGPEDLAAAEAALQALDLPHLRRVASELSQRLPQGVTGKAAIVAYLMQELDSPKERGRARELGGFLTVGLPQLAPRVQNVIEETKAPDRPGDVDGALRQLRELGPSPTEGQVVRLLDADQGLTPAKLQEIGQHLGVDMTGVKSRQKAQLRIAEAVAAGRTSPEVGHGDGEPTTPAVPSSREVEHGDTPSVDATPTVNAAEIAEIIGNPGLSDESKQHLLTSYRVPESQWPEHLRTKPKVAPPTPTADERHAAGFPDVPPGVNVDEDTWTGMSYDARLRATVAARVDATPNPDDPARQAELSPDELATIRDLGKAGVFTRNGWVRGQDLTPARQKHLDALASMGWVEKNTTAEGAYYRLDTRSFASRQPPADGGALAGDLLPAPARHDSRISLHRVRRGAIIDGYRSPDGRSFGNLPETDVDQSRRMRVVVQRLELLDENGEPTKALGLALKRRIYGHDADTGARVQSDAVGAGSHWSWTMNPEEDGESPDLEGEFTVRPEHAAVAPPASPNVDEGAKAAVDPDDPARQAEVEAAVRKAAPKLSTAPVIPNTWGGGTGRDGEVSFHPNGEIGRALTSMGDEDRVEVDGQPLRNVVGLIATDAQRGRKTPQETVDALKTVRDKLPEGRAKTALSGAISAIDAPPRRVDLPAGTPQALVDLMDRFADNPLARRDVDQFGRAEPNEMDRLAALAQRYAEKPISRAMIDDVRRDLFNRRHESVEFKAQLDRDVQKALADLDEERKTPRTASPTATYASRSASVQALSAQTPTAIRGLGGGTSRTTLREYPDGSKLVHKDQLRSATGQDAKGLTDAEVLGSLVLNATGVHAPATHRTGPSDVDMEWIPGKTGSEILGASGAGSPGPEFVDSRDGRLMGLADALMLNPDRQPGNWLVGDDGRLSGIDHGFGFEFQTPEAAAVNPFARHFITERPTSHDQDTWAPTNDMSPLDMAVIRARLEALRPQFEAAGRGNWWSAMMQRMDILSAAAQGTESRNP